MMRALVAAAFCLVPAAAALGGSDGLSEGDMATIADSAPVCRSMMTVRDLLRMVDAGDKEAFTAAMMRHAGTGECRIMVKGTQVQIMDIETWQGMVRVRRRSEPDSDWTARGYVEKMPVAGSGDAPANGSGTGTDAPD